MKCKAFAFLIRWSHYQTWAYHYPASIMKKLSTKKIFYLYGAPLLAVFISTITNRWYHIYVQYTPLIIVVLEHVLPFILASDGHHLSFWYLRVPAILRRSRCPHCIRATLQQQHFFGYIFLFLCPRSKKLHPSKHQINRSESSKMKLTNVALLLAVCLQPPEQRKQPRNICRVCL